MVQTVEVKLYISPESETPIKYYLLLTNVVYVFSGDTFEVIKIIDAKGKIKEIRKKYDSVPIDHFKYIDNIKKYCWHGKARQFGTNILGWQEIKKGLGVIVKILLTKEITDSQVKFLNQSYNKIVETAVYKEDI